MANRETSYQLWLVFRHNYLPSRINDPTEVREFVARFCNPYISAIQKATTPVTRCKRDDELFVVEPFWFRSCKLT